MLLNELKVNKNNVSRFYFAKIYMKNGTVFQNVRGVDITDEVLVLATKITGNIGNQLILLRSEICAIEYGEVRYNKKTYL